MPTQKLEVEEQAIEREKASPTSNHQSPIPDDLNLGAPRKIPDERSRQSASGRTLRRQRRALSRAEEKLRRKYSAQRQKGPIDGCPILSEAQIP